MMVMMMIIDDDDDDDDDDSNDNNNNKDDDDDGDNDDNNDNNNNNKNNNTNNNNHDNIIWTHELHCIWQNLMQHQTIKSLYWHHCLATGCLVWVAWRRSRHICVYIFHRYIEPIQ